MGNDIEYVIEFAYGGKVFLQNTDDKRDRHDITSLGLDEDEHDQCYIDEEDIDFKTIDTKNGKRKKVISMCINGDIFRFKPAPRAIANTKNRNNRPTRRNTNKAFAPYNFIPLNRQVGTSNNDSNHSEFAIGKNSGYLEYELENLTDLYIREEGGKSNFFGKKLKKEKIPGSSMRGMIRTLYEIITYSKIGEVDSNRRFFNRKVGRDMSRYKERILDNQRAGWVMRKGRDYFLMDAQPITRNNNYIKVAVDSVSSRRDRGFEEKVRNRGDFFVKWNDLGLGLKEREYAWDEVYAKTERCKVKDIVLDHKPGYMHCILFQTGHIFSKKHQYLIGLRYENAERWDVTDSVNLGISDERRANSYKLFDKMRSQEHEWFPCFYIQETFEGKKEYIIGETPMFRLPYEKQVRDLLPTTHKNEALDMATSVFGSTDMATRIYFEDAPAHGTIEYAPITGIQMLSDPKPTSFTHYAEEGRSYDEKAIIRGNKMYWHKKEDTYALDYSTIPKEKIQQYSPEIEPIRKAKFKGRIRFDNLSDEELGALLFLFNLPQGMALKLGMGKPFGMGSIKVNHSTLSIINRPKRYSKLFDTEGNWNTSDQDSPNNENYIDKFIAYVSQYESEIKSKSDFFQNNRMRQLAAMLTFDHKKDNWLSNTRYMDLKEFKEDTILEYPTKYLNK